MARRVLGMGLLGSMALWLAGCGGGAGNSSDSGQPVRGATGVWTGLAQIAFGPAPKTTFTGVSFETSQNVDLTVLPGGEYHLVASDLNGRWVYVAGTMIFSGDDFSGPANAYILSQKDVDGNDTLFADGTKATADVRFSGTAPFTATSTHASFDLFFNPSLGVGGGPAAPVTLFYSQPFNLPGVSQGMVTGNYAGENGFAASIDAQGTLSGQGSDGSYSGTIQAISQSVNAFRATWTVTAPSGVATTFRGIATLRDSQAASREAAGLATTASKNDLLQVVGASDAGATLVRWEKQ